MPIEAHQEKLSVEEFARQMHDQMIPLGNRFSYFFTALPLNEDDIKEYLEEPISALPPSLRAVLPEVSILLVPYLEKGAGKGKGEEPEGNAVCFEQPAAELEAWSSRIVTPERAVLVFALKGQDVANYHYRFFRILANLAVEIVGADVHDQFFGILRDELSSRVHGEVDEESWQLKQALVRKQRNLQRKTKGLTAYARQALVDTLTLYLHGICCDIDVETGPRQLASSHLRRRLELCQSVFPPPDGYALFPEDLNHAEAK